MSVRVKICGITSEEDALLAVEAGADALGFIFYERSSRFISPDNAKAIISKLPPFIARVGVFVNAPADQIERAIEQGGINVIQLHGDETAEFAAQFSIPVIKAIRVKNHESISTLATFQSSAFLLDSYVEGQLGGSGATFNWTLAGKAKDLGRPIILAGGLTPLNIREAIRTVQPYGVDVSSGVEHSPGKKDAAKVSEFISNAKTA